MHENIEKTRFYKNVLVTSCIYTNGISSKLKMHENVEKTRFYKNVLVTISINTNISIDTNSNEHIFIKSCFSMFSCILSFDNMPLVLSPYKLRPGTQVPVGSNIEIIRQKLHWCCD